jgi:translation initiation factor 5
MATFNVNRFVTDLNYRYKMPALTVKIEPIPKRRNRCQTLLSNIERVSKCLGVQGVNPEFILKWLSLELGISQKISTETRKNRTIKSYILLSSVQPDLLQPKLDSFISNWVLCKTCQNPETSLWKSDKKTISQRCFACGKVNSKNLTDKFSKFIVIKLPEIEPEPPKKYQNEQNEEKLSPTNSINAVGWNDGDDFELETDDFSAIDRTMKLYQAGAETISLTSLKNFPEKSRINAFLKYLTELRERLGEKRFMSSNREIELLVTSFQLKSAAIKPIFQSFLKWKKKFSFDKIKSLITSHKKFFESICILDTVNCEREIFGQFQLMIDFNRKSLLKLSVNIFHCLYDNDVISEDVILEWNSGKLRFLKEDVDKRMKDHCTKLINWLETAESESESEEDDEEVQIINQEVSDFVRKYYDYESEVSEVESDVDISQI